MMKTAIVGAGAIGTVLASYMMRGGADVTLVDLPDVVGRIHRNGVEIRTLSGEVFKVGLKATSDPQSLSDIDFIIICVKTFYSDAAVSSVAHLKDRVQAVLSIQNGVDKEEVLKKYFGREKIIGGCCLEAASRLDEKTIMHTMSVVTYLGELDGTISPRVEAAVRLFKNAGLTAEANQHVVSAGLVQMDQLCCRGGRLRADTAPYYKVLLHPQSAGLIAEIYKEYAELAAACGVEVFDYPGFEVKTIARPLWRMQSTCCRKGAKISRKKVRPA